MKGSANVGQSVDLGPILREVKAEAAKKLITRILSEHMEDELEYCTKYIDLFSDHELSLMFSHLSKTIVGDQEIDLHGMFKDFRAWFYEYCYEEVASEETRKKIENLEDSL